MHLKQRQQLRWLTMASSRTPHMRSTNISCSRQVDRRNQWIRLRLHRHTLYQAHQRPQRWATPRCDKWRTVPCQYLKATFFQLRVQQKSTLFTVFSPLRAPITMQLNTSNSFERTPPPSDLASQMRDDKQKKRDAEKLEFEAWLDFQHFHGTDEVSL